MSAAEVVIAAALQKKKLLVDRSNILRLDKDVLINSLNLKETSLGNFLNLLFF